MPRNPNKKRCEVNGCRAWAMRGHRRCRAHRDDELGPRGAGALPGNLNAVKHGRHAHPLPVEKLENLANALLEQPDDLPDRIGLMAEKLMGRAQDPLRLLIALRKLIDDLTAEVASRLYMSEMAELMEALPSDKRHAMWRMIRERGPRDDVVKMVRLVRLLRERLTT